MNTYKTDCYFYNEDYDMGAIISTCGADPNNFVWGKCECSKCKKFLSKADVDKIISLTSTRYDVENNNV